VLQALFALSAAANFLSLVVSLWLGFYIVTRSPRSKVSWLASATLWSLSGYFLNHLTYVQGPTGGTVPWWWGWSVAFAAPFWFHLSVMLLPPSLADKQRWLIWLIYFLALNVLAMEAYTPWVFAGQSGRLPIYNSAQIPGPLYPLCGLYFIAVPALSLYNLRQGRREAKSVLIQRQLAVLSWAAALAVFSGVYTALSVWLRLDTPAVLGNLSLGAGVTLLGYGVARHNALVEGRAIERDFVYTSLAMALVVAAYVLAAVVSRLTFGVPFVAFVFVIVLAVASHSLYDWGRSLWERLFYRQRYRELRSSLRDLLYRIAPEQGIQDSLQAILESLCSSLGASSGFIALRGVHGFDIGARWRVRSALRTVPLEALAADEVTVLSPPAQVADVDPIAVIAPLVTGGEQIGVVALGPRSTGSAYSEEDIDLLEDCADTVATVAHAARLQEKSVQQIEALLSEAQEREHELRQRLRTALAAEVAPLRLVGQPEKQAISLVEDALRHLYDYSYLGGHPLAQLRIVDSYLESSENAFVTHLDRGQALQRLLVSAIDKLRPPGAQPSLPKRHWYGYVMLHHCYVLGEPNRDVMGRLYVSEGTFNRARRRAVRGVTKALAEMERQAQHSKPA